VPESFRVNLSFDRAKNSMNNVIEGIDPATINKWIYRNSYEDYALGKYGQIFLPVGVTVGDEIAPNVKTVPGTYYFQVDIQYTAGIGTWEPYIRLPFSLIVK
jgi:hypothetical protein